MTKKILVTDCWTRKTLSAVRSLGQAGLEVHAVTHTRASPAIYSRFVSKYFLLPRPADDPGGDLKELAALLQKEKYDLVLPMEDDTSKVLLEHSAKVEAYTNTVLPSSESYCVASDKWRTLELAKRLHVPVPRSVLAREVGDALQFADEAGYPVVMKPRAGSGSRGLSISKNTGELQKNFIRALRRYPEMIVQEKIVGQGLGVGILADRGEVRASLSYTRLREYPVTGGPSTLRETTDDATTKEYAQKLMHTLGWHGVAMVEFKYDKDGKPVLMEINPRFWGSLHLAYVSGINFPFLVYKLSQGEPIEPQNYRTGVRCRWLIPGDIMHFLANPRRFKMRPSFFKFTGTYYDEFMRGDMRGNIASVICPLFSIFDPNVWRLGIFRR